MHRIALLVLLVAWTHPASAQMYKCVDGATTVFQDKPCRGGGVPLNVTPANGAPAVSEKETSDKKIDKLREDVRAMEQERRKREIGYAIRDREREIAGYQDAMDREMYGLQRLKAAATNSLAGATWEQSLSTEMQAIAEKYKVTIQVAQDRIAALRQELQQLPR